MCLHFSSVKFCRFYILLTFIQTELDAEYIPPQIFSCPLTEDKLTMYGLVYKPHNYEAGKKYPTVLFVYGGPHVQFVTNADKALR